MSMLRRILRAVFRTLFLMLVAFVGAPVAFVGTVFAGLIFLPLPATIPVAKATVAVQPTVIYDRFGHVIATLQQNQQNVPVTESEIPQVLKEAVIADEDRNFYHNNGFDLRGTLRALVADIRNQAPVQGGSTITQQYVKLVYTGSAETLTRKIREAILASQLSRQTSKDQILYRYLTLVYLGDGNTGVGAAAQSYFHVPVQKLDISQAATLAGLIPAPSARAPRQNLLGAEQARELVLSKMHQQGYLTGAEYQQALSEKLALASSGTPPPGSTVIYPVPSTVVKYPDFVNYVTDWLLAHYPPSMVYGGGLRVQTTLDPRIQNDAYAAVASTLSGTHDPLEMALASVQPQTGFVQALVGGRAYGHQGAPFSSDNFALAGCDPAPPPSTVVQVRATCWNGKSIGSSDSGGVGRQPGSAWKPFVLATAFEQGIPPDKVFPVPGIYHIPGCTPSPAQNCEIVNEVASNSNGSATLAEATAASINTVYGPLAGQVGCVNVAKTAKALGIQSAYYSSALIPFCQTYALGVVDVAPLDMASAYGVFANHGQRAQPTPILQIVNAAGKVLVDNISHPPATKGVLPANVANNVTNTLEGVLGPGGTAGNQGIGRPAAGKTGTTNNYTNGWFVGYTPTLSTAVWMGGSALSQSVSLGDVKGVDPVFGGTWPAATWKGFMTQALQGVPPTNFTQPAPITPPVAALRPTAADIRPGPAVPVLSTPSGGPYQQSPPVLRPPPAPLILNQLTSSPTTFPGATSTTTSTTLPATGSTTTTRPSSTITLPGLFPP
ncbi:MAG: transglycosylase domain-containing protein [Acidimicrobiales bacterium]